MLIEVLIIGVLLYVILEYNGSISTNKFLNDNKDIFNKMKEKDYDFYLKAKYGDAVDIQSIYNARLRNGMLVMFLLILFFIADLSYIKVIITLIAAYGVFKLPYFQIKRYYKAHLSQIDMMLPYYLKSLEILVQHYTVPVALGKSVNEAPEIFRNGFAIKNSSTNYVFAAAPDDGEPESLIFAIKSNNKGVYLSGGTSTWQTLR